MSISLTAKGLTTGEVQAHVVEVYGTEVSRENVLKIADARSSEVVRELVEVEVAVLSPGAAEWQAGEKVKSHEEDRR